MLLKRLLYKYILRLIPDSLWIKIQFKRKMGYWPNLKDPKTFNEKLQWLKLHDRNPLYTKLVDKYEVREYVAKTIGEEYLIPLLGVWDKFDDIDFDKLPNQFVLKCTHDSGGLVICTDKSKLNIATAKKKINDCLKFNYYLAHREWPYKNVKPRIIAEKLMVDTSGEELIDYKVHCFNGEPNFILVCKDRSKGKSFSEDFYSTSWEHLDISRPNHPNSAKTTEKPALLNTVLELSRKFAFNKHFIRCDFYIINRSIYFGELTLYPASGFSSFHPDKWDENFGNLIKDKMHINNSDF